MPDEYKAIIVGLIVTAGMRLIDWVLPPKHHFRFVNRIGVSDDEPKEITEDDN